MVSKGMGCVLDRTSPKGGDLYGVFHSKKALPGLVDLFVRKLFLLASKENELLVEEIDGATLACKTGKFPDFLVALFVFTKYFNLAFGREDYRNCRFANKSVCGLRLVTAIDTGDDRSLV